MTMKTCPVVAIVGRPNVGKSELFNRIARRKISLVFDQPGVTRDRLQATCRWQGIEFDLIDTGGIGLEDESGFEAAIEREVALAVDIATDILFVVDGRQGLHTLDREVARRLRKAQRTKRIFLVVNKIDEPQHEALMADFHALGLDKMFTVSAAHGRGIGELMESIAAGWPVAKEVEGAVCIKQTRGVEPGCDRLRAERADGEAIRLGVVGRPNVGKSSLVNALLGEDRVIVSDTPGTTRDAVDIEFRDREKDKRYTLIDTAGMRKKSRIADPLEQAMTGRSAHVIDRAHIGLLVIDAIAGAGEQEKKIAGLIQQAHKPCMIVVNKWDLAEQEFARQKKEDKIAGSLQGFQKKYQKGILETLFFLPYAHVIFTSARKPRSLKPLLTAIEDTLQASRASIGTGELNRILQRALERQPPPRLRGRAFKIYYATQIQGKDVPTLNVFINKKTLLSESYLRYLEQNLRRAYPCPGVPIVWIFREKQEKTGKR